jgi:hypothetical protein
MADTDWELAGFQDRFDAWERQEHPDGRTRHAVLVWIMTRYDDPYRGARRASDLPNLWWIAIPGSAGGGTVVVCSFAVEEARRVVVCYSIATLNQPVM